LKGNAKIGDDGLNVDSSEKKLMLLSVQREFSKYSNPFEGKAYFSAKEKVDEEDVRNLSQLAL
jgi:hypothetical protein